MKTIRWYLVHYTATLQFFLVDIIANCSSVNLHKKDV